MKLKSFFISFEGLEGAGKSTQTELLVGRLREQPPSAGSGLGSTEGSWNGREVVATREPGGTRIGEQIRAITHSRGNVDLTAETETYLMAAARAQHVSEIIVPALEDGKIVVCDRFIDSSLAYQGYGRELGAEVVFDLNKLALGQTSDVYEDKHLMFKTPVYEPVYEDKHQMFIMPDLTILLDVDYDNGIARRNGTEKIDRLDLQQRGFYERVREGYEEISERYAERIVRVNGNGTIEETAEKVWKIVQKSLDSAGIL